MGTDTRPRNRAVAASFVGTAIEWYDFFIYSTAAALVFGKQFFPDFAPMVGTLLSFSTFVVGFVARPIGGVLFGHLGDRAGRKSVLVVTLSLMGACTFVIGLLPTYAQVGVWAPILLVTVRFVQGIALGGEYGGAVLMAVEHSSPARRGFFGSWVQVGVPVGLALSNLVFLLIQLLPDGALESWGWRVPFLLSALLVAVGFFIRLRVDESPEFREVAERGAARRPAVEAVKRSWAPILLCAAAGLAPGTMFYATMVFGLSYGTDHVEVSRGTMLGLTLLSMAVVLPCLLWFGALSDRVGRKPVFAGGVLGMALTAFPWLLLVDTGSFVPMLIGYLLVSVPFSAAYGTLATLLAELFPAGVRYSAVNISYAISNVFGAGMAPIVATSLLLRTDSGLPIAGYIVLVCGVSFVCLAALRETAARRAGDGAAATADAAVADGAAR
ncbi:MFS transporter [Actinomadura fibrosa]|uniref:MFS transporter n=1 Tax=Actinomadura fibrosa TaxID=111802 RepID=A0ABW2Y1T4_9ACTN|nr:MFS transporter [Actinomadura fibrosa]